MQEPTGRSRKKYLSSSIIAVALACALMIVVWPLIQASARAAARRTDHTNVSQARERWESHDFTNYRLSMQLQSWDNPVCEVAFEVRPARPSKVVLDTCASRHDTALLNFIEKHNSVPDLFNYIESKIDQGGGCGPNGCACDGRRIVDVLYDRDHGYPRRFTERYQHDWTTQRRFLSGCTLMGPAERILFAASVSSLE